MSEQGAEGTQQAAAPEVDFSPIVDRIGELGEQMNQGFQQMAPAQQQQDQQFGEPDYFDGYTQQEPGFQYGEPQQQQEQAPQEGMQLLQQMVQQATQQAMGPLMQRFEAEDQQKMDQAWEQSVEAVEQKYPELQGEMGETIAQKSFEIADQVAKQTLQRLPGPVRQAIQQAGVDLGQLIAIQPGFFENVYLAGKATVSAEQETPASTSQGTELEQGGGAAVSSDQGPGSQWLGGGDGGPKSLDQVLGW